MNYADIRQYDVANGVGIRVSLFVSGCTHYCRGCFNEEAWDFDYGKPFTEKEFNQIIEYLQPDYIKGLTLLGGEPFETPNITELVPLLRCAKEKYPRKSIWCYTGYLYDKDILEDMCKKDKLVREMISYIDILIDGKFVKDMKNLKLAFRGSSNQRVIDVKKSLSCGRVVLWESECEGD